MSGVIEVESGIVDIGFPVIAITLRLKRGQGQKRGQEPIVRSTLRAILLLVSSPFFKPFSKFRRRRSWDDIYCGFRPQSNRAIGFSATHGSVICVQPATHCQLPTAN